MRPILFWITQDAYVHSGDFMLFVGGLLGILFTLTEMKRIGQRPEKIYPLLLLIFVSAICGARALYCISSWHTHHYSLLSFLTFWQGGMSLYGGAILAFIVYLIYVIWQRLDFWRTADMLAPSVAIFIFSARVGCLLAGCCYGRQCEPGFPLAVTFRDPAALAPKDGPLYPSQLFFAASALLIFLILWTQRRHKAFEGEISLIGVSIFSVTSFVIEYFRGDARVLYEMFGATISQNQIISATIFLLSISLYVLKAGVFPARFH